MKVMSNAFLLPFNECHGHRRHFIHLTPNQLASRSYRPSLTTDLENFFTKRCIAGASIEYCVEKTWIHHCKFYHPSVFTELNNLDVRFSRIRQVNFCHPSN